MAVVAHPPKILRFATFEVDLHSGELRKQGLRIRLQDQPFQVLAALLHRPGDLVTREELRSQLWPQDTFVDFDTGLNTAIKKLREALGDSADNPCFIETLPRRGYRFVAPVSSDQRRKAPGKTQRGLWISAAIVAVIGAVAGSSRWLAWRNESNANAPERQRIMLAVLPFQNFSNDSEQEYFSDGLTEETITDLGQLNPQQLGVIARTSAMAYKHTSKTAGQIAKDLTVDYILEGSVRREGDRARISVQLMRGKDQTHIWAQNYDTGIQGLLALEAELGKAISQQVQVNLLSERKLAEKNASSINHEAYDDYLKGRYYWNQRTPPALKRSIEFFQRAVGKDPNFALAYAGLADAYNFTNILGVTAPRESSPQAKAAATRAVMLDPQLAEAHAVLGLVMSHYDFDFPGAQREFLKAIELNPNCTNAHLYYSGGYLTPMGRHHEAIAEMKKALELDPLSLPMNNYSGNVYLWAGDYENSLQQFQHTIDLDPRFPLVHFFFPELLVEMGKYEQAIEERQKGLLLTGTIPEEANAFASEFRKAFQTGGPDGYRQKNLEFTLAQYKQAGTRYFPAIDVAGAYARAGDKENAFMWLEKSYEQRDGGSITLLRWIPAFKSLHGDPRFNALLKRMGLPT